MAQRTQVLYVDDIDGSDAEGTVLRVRGEPEAVGRLREQLGETAMIRPRG